jgi:hypothetical protein
MFSGGEMPHRAWEVAADATAAAFYAWEDTGCSADLAQEAGCFAAARLPQAFARLLFWELAI